MCVCVSVSGKSWEREGEGGGEDRCCKEENKALEEAKERERDDALVPQRRRGCQCVVLSLTA